MQNEPNRAEGPRSLDRPRPAAARVSAPARRALALTGVVLLAVAAVAGGYALLRQLPADGHAKDGPPDGPVDTSIKPGPFAGWGTPALALVLSGQMHGYLGPCGCSVPQYGGLVRRESFIQSLRAKSWPVAGIDLGELVPTAGIQRQRELKALYTMKALDLMGYKAVGLGKGEMTMPLVEFLSQHSVNNPSPRPIASTLEGPDNPGNLLHKLNARPYEIFGGDNGVPRIGVLSLTGPDLETLIAKQTDLKFRNNKTQVLPQAMQAFVAQKVDAAVLLHHEYPAGELNAVETDQAREKMVTLLAQTWEATRQKHPNIPPLQLVMVLTEMSEPPAVLRPVPGTPTHLVELGHKGKYVGVVGLFIQNGSLVPRYELVLMDPGYEPGPAQSNKTLQVMEEYERGVKSLNLLAEAFRSPHPLQIDPDVAKKYGGSRFVGSAACQKCHPEASAVWEDTKHANAFKPLVEVKNKPSLRQFDPECVVCHTVGFKYHEGYNDLPRFVQAKLKQEHAAPAAVEAERQKHNAALAHVGCENCHGPGSAHAGNPKDLHVRRLMNPFRPSDAEVKAAREMDSATDKAARDAAARTAKRLFDARMSRLDGFCAKCHDEENDVHWTKMPFLQKWAIGQGNFGPIVHNGPDNVGNRWLPDPPRPAKK